MPFPIPERIQFPQIVACGGSAPIDDQRAGQPRRRIIIFVIVLVFAAGLVLRGEDLSAVTAAVTSLVLVAADAGRRLLDSPTPQPPADPAWGAS